MTGEAIKRALEYHNIIPKTIQHYKETVCALFFPADKWLNVLIKKMGGRWSNSSKYLYNSPNLNVPILGILALAATFSDNFKF